MWLHPRSSIFWRWILRSGYRTWKPSPGFEGHILPDSFRAEGGGQKKFERFSFNIWVLLCCRLFHSNTIYKHTRTGTGVTVNVCSSDTHGGRELWERRKPGVKNETRKCYSNPTGDVGLISYSCSLICISFCWVKRDSSTRKSPVVLLIYLDCFGVCCRILEVSAVEICDHDLSWYHRVTALRFTDNGRKKQTKKTPKTPTWEK